MSFFLRKKPPTLTVVEELQQTYNDCCNLSIKNISLEENGEYEDALKGWKSLHTSLLYKIALFDKNLYKLSNGELTILVDLKSIRDENVRHLVRVQMLVDESNRKKLAEKHQATLLAAKQAQGQSAHSAPSPTPPSNSRNNSSMSVPSLRNGARPRAQVSSTPRSMLKSLRPPAINTKVNPNQAASAATSSWNKPVRKVAPRPSLPNLSQGHSQQGSSGPTSRAPRSTENLFDDFDQDTYKVNGSNGSVNGRSSLGRSSNSDSLSNLIDLSDHYEDDDDEDILHDYFSTDLDLPTLPSLPSLPLLPLAPTMPVESLAKMDLKSKSTTSIPKRREETKVAPKPKKPYVYVKPKPMDVNAVMKKTLENAKRNTTNASMVPVAKKNISYNYVKPPAPKAVRKKKESLPAPEKAADKVPEKVPSAAAPPEVSPEAPPDDHDLLIASIKGIDPIMAKQILNDIVVNGDEVYWEDIVGLDSAKNSLKEAVVYPFLRPDLFRGLREPTRGMLLFGPPGTGKTMLARAVATESKSTFFSISASSLTSKYLGESEKLVKALFLLAKKLAPSIVFIDEIDSMLSSRSDGEVESSRRIKNEFLVLWSELSSAAAGRDSGDDVSRVLILGATNLPWSIDEAARRRFVRRQYIPLPEGETRKNQIEKLLKYQNHTLLAQDFTDLIELTDGFSGSDLTALAKDSAMGPLRALGDDLLLTPTEDIRPINLDDFRSSLNYIRPSVSKEGLKEYENWATKFGSLGA